MFRTGLIRTYSTARLAFDQTVAAPPGRGLFQLLNTKADVYTFQITNSKWNCQLSVYGRTTHEELVTQLQEKLGTKNVHFLGPEVNIAELIDAKFAVQIEGEKIDVIQDENLKGFGPSGKRMLTLSYIYFGFGLLTLGSFGYFGFKKLFGRSQVTEVQPQQKQLEN